VEGVHVPDGIEQLAHVRRVAAEDHRHQPLPAGQRRPLVRSASVADSYVECISDPAKPVAVPAASDLADLSSRRWRWVVDRRAWMRLGPDVAPPGQPAARRRSAGRAGELVTPALRPPRTDRSDFVVRKRSTSTRRTRRPMRGTPTPGRSRASTRSR
jgi:hypothetical protein